MKPCSERGAERESLNSGYQTSRALSLASVRPVSLYGGSVVTPRRCRVRLPNQKVELDFSSSLTALSHRHFIRSAYSRPLAPVQVKNTTAPTGLLCL